MMTASNLAIVFGPTIMGSESGTFDMDQIEVVAAMIADWKNLVSSNASNRIYIRPTTVITSTASKNSFELFSSPDEDKDQFFSDQVPTLSSFISSEKEKNLKSDIHCDGRSDIDTVYHMNTLTDDRDSLPTVDLKKNGQKICAENNRIDLSDTPLSGSDETQFNDVEREKNISQSAEQNLDLLKECLNSHLNDNKILDESGENEKNSFEGEENRGLSGGRVEEQLIEGLLTDEKNNEVEEIIFKTPNVPTRPTRYRTPLGNSQTEITPSNLLTPQPHYTTLAPHPVRPLPPIPVSDLISPNNFHPNSIQSEFSPAPQTPLPSHLASIPTSPFTPLPSSAVQNQPKPIPPPKPKQLPPQSQEVTPHRPSRPLFFSPTFSVPKSSHDVVRRPNSFNDSTQKMVDVMNGTQYSLDQHNTESICTDPSESSHTNSSEWSHTNPNIIDSNNTELNQIDVRDNTTQLMSFQPSSEHQSSTSSPISSLSPVEESQSPTNFTTTMQSPLPIDERQNTQETSPIHDFSELSMPPRTRSKTLIDSAPTKPTPSDGVISKPLAASDSLTTQHNPNKPLLSSTQKIQNTEDEDEPTADEIFRTCQWVFTQPPPQWMDEQTHNNVLLVLSQQKEKQQKMREEKKAKKEVELLEKQQRFEERLIRKQQAEVVKRQSEMARWNSENKRKMSAVLIATRGIELNQSRASQRRTSVLAGDEIDAYFMEKAESERSVNSEMGGGVKNQSESRSNLAKRGTDYDTGAETESTLQIEDVDMSEYPNDEETMPFIDEKKKSQVKTERLCSSCVLL
jgi:hypothetical protein